MRKTPRKRRRVLGRSVSIGFALALAALGLSPSLHRLWTQHELEGRLAVQAQRPALELPDRPVLAMRVQQLGPLLASWETVGGCGAGGSGAGGTGIRWIGHGTTGGLFDLQVLNTYSALPPSFNTSGGYVYSVNALVTRDIGDKWNLGFSVPFLYKYYENYADLSPPVDISNSGLGDVQLQVARKLGPIDATMATLSIGLPTGTHDAEYKMDPLTQDKQLGAGTVSGSLTLDHTLDELWGIIIVGGNLNYRGGENEFGNYRAPAASAYGYGGYFLGPLVPALGLSVTRFWDRDRDRGIEQAVPLATVAGSASVEWSNDYVAVLVGGSLPYSLVKFDAQPWLVGLGVTVSPF